MPGSRSGSVDYSQQQPQQPPQLQSPQHAGGTPGISLDGSNPSARSSLQGTPTLGNNTIPSANLGNHGANDTHEGDDMLNLDLGLDGDDEMGGMDISMGEGEGDGDGDGDGSEAKGSTLAGENIYDNDQDNQQQQEQFGLGGFELNDDEDDVMSGFLNL